MASDILVCPFCGGKEFVIAEQSGLGNIHICKKVLYTSTALMHQVCIQCGAVVKSYAKDMDELLGNKSRW